MKNKTLRGLLRLAAFALCFVPVLLLADTFLIKTDTYTRLTLAEMKQRDDIDMVFVGSSIVRDHFNAELITEQTGLQSFSLGIPCAGLQADLAVTKEFYRTNRPEWTVLVVEPFTFDTVKEGIEAQYELMPYLSSPVERVKYYLNLCREDGWYLDRLCMFRDFGVDSFSDFCKTVGLHFRPFETYEKLKPALDKRMTYAGRGYVRHNTKDRAKKAVRRQIIREYTGYYYDLFPRSKEMLLEYRDLVAQNGSRLLVFIYPNMTVHNLAIPGFLDYNAALMRFCKENDIECVNFSLAKPELYPRKTDDYYFDLYHMVGDGADIFSFCFSAFFNAYVAGEDTSGWFYESNAQYLDSVTVIPNCWIQTYRPGEAWNMAWEQDEQTVRAASENGARDVYLANCNHGTSVTPEYRFFLRDESSETETPLTDWQTEGILACPKGGLSGQCIRVYARVQGGADDPELYYDFRPDVDDDPCLQV